MRLDSALGKQIFIFYSWLTWIDYEVSRPQDATVNFAVRKGAAANRSRFVDTVRQGNTIAIHSK